jgi:Flp pilus assembly protein TadD
MSGKTIKTFISIAVIAVFSLNVASAKDGITITIPRRSKLTPVQRLNREGVDAVRKHDFDKAGALFYKAYLYDPADPFTLNNLGYISEIQGQLDRAHKFYQLASEQGTNANIDRSNAKDLEGKPMNYAFDSLQDLPMRVNRMNVDAMSLLSNARGFEATGLLQKALALDSKNPFTLNNLGVAHESIGDYDNALKYYGKAAQMNSAEAVVVAQNQAWRGKPVSKMAEASSKRLQSKLRNMNSEEAHSIMLTMRGVSATNQNDWITARQDFLTAYSLNPESAFALNNRGYVAERDGDLESAQFFYEKARKAFDSTTRVGLATQRYAEGRNLSDVATDSNQKVDNALDRYRQQRRLEQGPVELVPRGGATEKNSNQPPEKQPPSNAPSPVPPTSETQSPQ